MLPRERELPTTSRVKREQFFLHKCRDLTFHNVKYDWEFCVDFFREIFSFIVTVLHCFAAIAALAGPGAVPEAPHHCDVISGD
jgi:hypothetical protein